MKILVLSFYFEPDLSAGSFRATALVEALRQSMPAGSSLDVITTLPNRYRSFTVDAPAREERDGVSITRILLPGHRSGMLDQSRAFLSFARQAARAAGRDYDLVVATSSRLMTAALGAWIARRARAQLYLDMRDIFTDTIGEVAPRMIARLTGPLLARLERSTVRRAHTVNLISRGFADYFTSRYPGTRFTYFTNGIDEEFLATGRSAEVVARNGPGPLTVLYAGNLGEGQGLHAILPALAKRMESRVRFQIVGDGGRRRALERALAASGATNVELHPPVSRAELVALYRAADVLFVHLNDYEAFKKVLPSKLFEYAATGKPMWAGVAGYAATFIRDEIDNAAVFAPCAVEEAIESFDRLVQREVPRTAFVAKYTRRAISRAMAADILAAASERR